jgi:GTPase SAR1 family protein
MQLRNTDVALLVFAFNNHMSVRDVATWHELVQQNAPGSDFVVVGTKSDWVPRIVPTEFGKAVAFDLHVTRYVETSAKEGTGIDELFRHIFESPRQEMRNQ